MNLSDKNTNICYDNVDQYTSSIITTTTTTTNIQNFPKQRHQANARERYRTHRYLYYPALVQSNGNII